MRTPHARSARPGVLATFRRLGAVIRWHEPHDVEAGDPDPLLPAT